MQVTKGTWYMCEQCVPGFLSSSSHKSLETRLTFYRLHDKLKSLWDLVPCKNLWYSKQTIGQVSWFTDALCSPTQNNIPTMMQVHCTEQTKDVLLRALDMLAIAVRV